MGAVTGNPPVIVVGAGLAGLSCAHSLHTAGIAVQILEAADGVGGRVRTDRVEGFLLDRGFQVLLTAYPEARRILDYTALDLKSFYPGALVWTGQAFHKVADPWRRPTDAVASVLAPVGTLGDKLRTGWLRRHTLTGPLHDLFSRPETTTRARLSAWGFSGQMVERFFRPFLGGVFLEPDLATSSRMFEFVMRMFAEGDAALPARGMAAIPEQIAAGLPRDSVRLNARATTIETFGGTAPARGAARHVVHLAAGDRLDASAVVLAVDNPARLRLVPERRTPEPVSRSVTCVYFAAERPPVDTPILVLNGSADTAARGPINNLCVPSVVAPGYAPQGASLVSATVLGNPEMDDSALTGEVRTHLRRWFGSQVARWRHLRTYRIAHALPAQEPPLADTREVRLGPGLYGCGDAFDIASIQGAMRAGRRAAEALLDDLRMS